MSRAILQHDVPHEVQFAHLHTNVHGAQQLNDLCRTAGGNALQLDTT